MIKIPKNKREKKKICSEQPSRLRRQALHKYQLQEMTLSAAVGIVVILN